MSTQNENLQNMYTYAMKDILERRAANGFPATEEKSLLLAVRKHVEGQITEAMIEGFCDGTIELREENGETVLNLAKATA